MYCVYMHINKINKKRYIGLTSQAPEQRWKKGEGYKGCPHFYYAIKKYGWGGFEHRIVASDLTKEEACNMEISLIKEYKTTDEAYGYNLDSGGQAGKHSEETKQKLHDMFTGKIVSEETKRKIKESCKHRSRRSHTKETIEKIRQAKVGHGVTQETREKLRNAFGKAVVCIETGEVFSSITAAAKSIGKDKTTISAVLHGRNQTAGGFHWEYQTQ